jgi:hypothetical protein
MDSLHGFPFLDVETWPAVSIYVPAGPVRMKKEVEPATRLRILLRQAEHRLETLGQRVPERQALLAPALKLLDDPYQWQRQEPGLALFLAPGKFHRVWLSRAPAELVVVARHFHIRPLLPSALVGQPFHLLAISARQARLLRCGGGACQEVMPGGMPAGVQEIAAEIEFQETAQFNPIASPRTGSSPNVVTSHGVESPEELRKDELLDYLHRVDAALAPILNREKLPLVIAAEPEILGHFRGLCRYPHIHAEALNLNPFALPEGKLRQRAQALLAPGFAGPVGGVRDRILSRLGSGQANATLELAEIVPAAAYARVSALLVAEEGCVWGKFDAEQQRAVTHAERQPDDEDLVNFAAVMALANGAAVYPVPRAEMPRRALAAAALRY